MDLGSGAGFDSFLAAKKVGWLLFVSSAHRTRPLVVFNEVAGILEPGGPTTVPARSASAQRESKLVDLVFHTVSISLSTTRPRFARATT